MTSVAIVFHEPGERPLAVATINNDPELLALVARRALEQAEQESTGAARRNPVTGGLKVLEARRLKDTLELLCPGYCQRAA